MTEATEIIVIRHGETESNRARRWQGQSNSPLTEQGVEQSEAVARRLAGEEFAALYTSDMGRAVQMAEIIAGETGHEVLFDDRLRERHVGQFQGLTSDEVEARYPVAWAMHKNAGLNHVIPGGESIAQLFQRSLSCFDELARRHPGERIVIITHGGVLKGLYGQATGAQLEVLRTAPIPNAGINVFRFADDAWELVKWADVDHLAPPTGTNGG